MLVLEWNKPLFLCFSSVVYAYLKTMTPRQENIASGVYFYDYYDVTHVQHVSVQCSYNVYYQICKRLIKLCYCILSKNSQKSLQLYVT